MSPIWFDGGSFKLCVYNREEHQRPHVAVMAGRRRLATVAVETGQVLAGSLSPQQHRTIKRLLAEHTQEALAAFEAGLRHEPVVRLDRRPQEGDQA
ncbi:DUF4160 domain-containing protein [Nocardioides psychrotolerans]|uniref:DUF4160 domain-containing protein n=1 Tax=Nocardioides psychrotolerans TaxID=1005945 RepID=UPI00313786D0